MKKIMFGLLVGCASSAAFAQSIVPTEKIIETVERAIMSSDVEYIGKPVVKAVPNGFTVNVPAGKVKNTAATPVAAFSFQMIEDGKLGNDTRYKVQLNKISEIFPSLEKMINMGNVTYSLLDYVAKFVPANGLVENQVLTIENLKIPMTEINANASAGKIIFTDSSELLENEKFKQENKLSLNNVTLSHPMATANIQSAEMQVVMPQVGKASSPLEQLMSTPSAQQMLSLKGVSLTSALAGAASVSFNLSQSTDTQQNLDNLDANVTFKMNISDFKMTTKDDLPTDINIDANISGFTFAEYLLYSAATDKLTENEMLPDSPRKNIILKTVQAEVDKAYNELTDNMVLEIKDVTIKANQYALVLKGNGVAKTQDFNGTLQVTNFDYLAPKPRVVDDAACQAIVDKMLSGELSGEAFQAQYEANCEDGTGILDALRPYASTARKVKDANGKDALLFDIQIRGENLLINGQKASDDVYSAPMELLN